MRIERTSGRIGPRVSGPAIPRQFTRKLRAEPMKYGLAATVPSRGEKVFHSSGIEFPLARGPGPTRSGAREPIIRVQDRGVPTRHAHSRIASPRRWNAACTPTPRRAGDSCASKRSPRDPRRRRRCVISCAVLVALWLGLSGATAQRRRGHDPVRLHRQHDLDPRRHLHDPAGRNHHRGDRKRDLPRQRLRRRSRRARRGSRRSTSPPRSTRTCSVRRSSPATSSRSSSPGPTYGQLSAGLGNAVFTQHPARTSTSTRPASASAVRSSARFRSTSPATSRRRT